MLKIDKTGVSTSKESIFGCSCRLWLLSWRRARIFARSCSCCRSTCQFRGNSEKSNHMLSATSHIGLEFLTKFLNMSKLQQSVDIAVPELAVTINQCYIRNYEKRKRIGIKDVEYRCNVNQDFAPHFNSLFYKNKVIEVLSTWP